jgi:hypothetical protein
MNSHIYFWKVDVHKISFLSNEKGGRANSKECQPDKMFFGMNFLDQVYAENFFW